MKKRITTTIGLISIVLLAGIPAIMLAMAFKASITGQCQEAIGIKVCATKR